MKVISTSLFDRDCDPVTVAVPGAVLAQAGRLPCTMSKGKATRGKILLLSIDIARREGIAAVTFGRIADALKMGKSGVFAHFQSRDNLVNDMLNMYWLRLQQDMLGASGDAEPGYPRLAAAFERCVLLKKAIGSDCVFVSVMAHREPQSDAIRDTFRQIDSSWKAYWRKSFEQAIDAGHLRRDSDCAQLIYELTGLLLACHQYAAGSESAHSTQYALRGFDRLIDACRPATASERAP